jgi:hypothetical protein
MPTELLRRGDLVLVASSSSPAAGLYRDEDEELRPAGRMDPDEWWWVLHCAAPVAVRACSRVDQPNPDREALAAAPPEQAALL